MTKGQTYHLNCSVFAILTRPDGRRQPITIPENSLVHIIGGPLNGNKLVELRWEDCEYLAFTADLRDCGSMVETAEIAT
jgi:hypothetical protein